MSDKTEYDEQEKNSKMIISTDSTGMKRKLFTLFIALFSLLVFETKAQEFTKAYGNDQENMTHSGKLSQTHNAYFILGTENEKTITLTKIDLNGNIIWAKKYSGEYYTFEFHEVSVPDKTTTDLIISASDYGTYNDLYIIRVDGNNGNVVWNKKIKYTSANRFINFVITSDNHIVAATTVRFNGGLFMTKMDINGKVLWARIINRSDGFQKSSNFVPDNNDGFLFGFLNGRTGLINISFDGKINFAYTTNTNTHIRSISKHPDNGYIISSYLDWNNRGTKNELIYINNDYNIVWKKLLNPATAHNGACDDCSAPYSIVNNQGEIIHVRESAISGQVKFNFSKFDRDGNHIYSASGNNNDLQFLSSGYGKTTICFHLVALQDKTSAFKTIEMPFFLFIQTT